MVTLVRFNSENELRPIYAFTQFFSLPCCSPPPLLSLSLFPRPLPIYTCTRCAGSAIENARLIHAIPIASHYEIVTGESKNLSLKIRLTSARLRDLKHVWTPPHVLYKSLVHQDDEQHVYILHIQTCICLYVCIKINI